MKEIEQVSVDECYMDFTKIAARYSSPIDGALEIKEGIKKKFGHLRKAFATGSPVRMPYFLAKVDFARTTPCRDV